MRKFIYYIALSAFIFVAPHSIGDTNFLPLKTLLFILFFVGPLLKGVNKVGEPIEKSVKKFKQVDDFKKNKFGI